MKQKIVINDFAEVRFSNDGRKVTKALNERHVSL